jgi:hypothetical protein
MKLASPLTLSKHHAMMINWLCRYCCHCMLYVLCCNARVAVHPASHVIMPRGSFDMTLASLERREQQRDMERDSE